MKRPRSNPNMPFVTRTAAAVAANVSAGRSDSPSPWATGSASRSPPAPSRPRAATTTSARARASGTARPATSGPLSPAPSPGRLDQSPTTPVATAAAAPSRPRRRRTRGARAVRRSAGTRTRRRAQGRGGPATRRGAGGAATPTTRRRRAQHAPSRARRGPGAGPCCLRGNLAVAGSPPTTRPPGEGRRDARPPGEGRSGRAPAPAHLEGLSSTRRGADRRRRLVQQYRRGAADAELDAPVRQYPQRRVGPRAARRDDAPRSEDLHFRDLRGRRGLPRNVQGRARSSAQRTCILKGTATFDVRAGRDVREQRQKSLGHES